MSRPGADDLDIEFVAPNAAAFGTSAHEAVAVDEFGGQFELKEPRSRWITVVAVVVAATLVVAGVVAAEPWNGDDASTTPTTSITIVPTVLTVLTVSVAPAADAVTVTPGASTGPIGWTVELPDDTWAFTGVSLQPGIADLGYLEHLDLWAEPGAARTAGRWLAIRSTPFDSYRLLPDGLRIDAGGRPAVVAVASDGVTTAEVRLPDGRGTIEVRSYGIGQDVVADLLATLTPVAGPSQVIDYATLLDVDGRLLGLDRQLAAPIPFQDLGLLGAPEVSTSYEGLAPGTTDEAVVVVSQRPLVTASGLPAVDLLFPPAVVDTGSTDVQVRSVLSEPTTLVVFWVQGDQLVTVTGYGLAPETLAQIASTAQPADEATWRTMVAASRPGVAVSQPAFHSELTTTGSYPTGDRWQAMVGRSSLMLSSIGLGPTTVNAFAFLADERGTTIRRFASVDVSVVLATSVGLPLARTMRVTAPDTGDSTAVEIQMEQLGADAVYAAVLPSIGDPPGLVELLDDTGAVVLSDAG